MGESGKGNRGRGIAGMGFAKEGKRTEQARAHGGCVFAHAAEGLDLEGRALQLADFEVAVAGGMGALEALRGEAEDGAERLSRAREGAGCWAEGGHVWMHLYRMFVRLLGIRSSWDAMLKSRWICHGAGCRELGSLAGPRPKICGVRSRVLPPCLSAIPVDANGRVHTFVYILYK